MAIVVATLVGFASRLLLINRFPLREDEALYGFWARHAGQIDPNFLTVWPDKPPLFLWTLSATLHFFGSSAAGARLLNIALSTLTIAVVAATAHHLWGRRAGAFAAVAMALNPFAIAFGPTVFTDPMLVFSGSLALLLALGRRALWAGLWLGVAIMTKQQGLLYIPLIGGALILAQRTAQKRAGKSVLHLLTGTLLVVGPLVLWDSMRWSVAPSPWDLSLQNYGRLTLLAPSAWPAHAVAWRPLLWELTGSWALWLGLALLWPLGRLQRPAAGATASPLAAASSPAFYAALLPTASFFGPSAGSALRLRLTSWRWILLWSIGFVALHIVTTIAVWDRYLLPLTPVVALLVAYLLDQSRHGAWARHSVRRQGAIALVALLLLLPPAWSAAQGLRPVGGDHGDYAGLDAALLWLENEINPGAPGKAVLYHHALGWHYQFYLFDAIQANRYELRWFPHPVYLADNAAKTPAMRMFMIQPDWLAQRELAQHLKMRNITLTPRFQAGKMTVYELQSPPPAYCDWCSTQLPEQATR